MKPREIRTRDAEEYRRVAGLLESQKEQYACYALDKSFLGSKDFIALFKKDALRHDYMAGLAFMSAGYESEDGDFDEYRAAQCALALCFMAAMVEAGDA